MNGSHAEGSVPTTAAKVVVASGTVHLGAVLSVLGLGVLSDGSAGDGLGGIPIVAIYGLPGVLALLAVRGRAPLLVAAGVASLVLALFPFSIHSFVLGPIGLIYLVAFARWPDPDEGGFRVAALAFPALLVAAFVVMLVHDDPTCYAMRESGEVTVDHDPGDVTSGIETMSPDSDVVESGCSSDTVVWWEATLSLVFSAAALATAMFLVRPRSRPGDASRS